MSDGISDSYQDERIYEHTIEINNLEKAFLENPSKDKARRIMKEYSNYMGMRGGFNTSPYTKYAREKISLFGEYMKEEISKNEIKSYLEIEESKIIGKVAMGSNGFSNLSLENIVLKIMEEDFKKDLAGRELFLVFKKKGNKIIIEYEKISKKYNNKRIERIKKYEKYLNLIEEKSSD